MKLLRLVGLALGLTALGGSALAADSTIVSINNTLKVAPAGDYNTIQSTCTGKTTPYALTYIDNQFFCGSKQIYGLSPIGDYTNPTSLHYSTRTYCPPSLPQC